MIRPPLRAYSEHLHNIFYPSLPASLSHDPPPNPQAGCCLSRNPTCYETYRCCFATRVRVARSDDARPTVARVPQQSLR